MRHLPTRACNRTAAVAIPLLLLAGWWASGPILSWVTTGPLAFTSATDMIVHRALGAAAFASPVIFGWLTTAVYGERSRSRGGLAVFGFFTGVISLTAFGAGTYRLRVLRAVLEEAGEAPVVMLRSLDHAVWAVAGAVVVSVLSRVVLSLWFRRRRPAPSE